MSRRENGRAAELRAERVGWKERSHGMNQTSRSMDGRLRLMKERAGQLDARLRRHREERASWHRKWGDPPKSG